MISKMFLSKKKSFYFSFFLSWSIFCLLCTTTFFSCTTLSSLVGVMNGTSDFEISESTIEATSKAVNNFSKAVEEITPENEYYIGRAVAATILTNYKSYENAVWESYLNKICQTLVINSEKNEIYNGYHVKILDSDEINAFATSGGHIFVTKGLVKCCKSEDELAAVIAHELSHIHLKHSLVAIKASRWTQAGISAASAMASTITENYSTIMEDMVGDIVKDLTNTGFSQAQEFQADSNALKLLESAGYDKNALISMLEELEKSEKSSENESGMFKTHPSPKLRIENVKKTIKLTDQKTKKKTQTKNDSSTQICDNSESSGFRVQRFKDNIK